MVLTPPRPDTSFRDSRGSETGCEVSVMFQDSFSEGSVYPLRALLIVAAFVMVLLAFVH
jgi:hypothetical protein